MTFAISITVIGAAVWLLSIWGAAKLSVNVAPIAVMLGMFAPMLMAMPLAAYLTRNMQFDQASDLPWIFVGSIPVAAAAMVPYSILAKRQSNRAAQQRRSRAEEAEKWIRKFGA